MSPMHRRVQAATNKIGTQVQQTARDAESGTNRLIGVLKGVGIAMIAAFSAQKIIGGIKDTVASTQELGAAILKLQRETGDTAEAASKLVFQVQHFGLDAGDASVALGILAKKLKGVQDEETGVTTGGKSTAAILADLGVNALDATGNLRPMADLIPAISDVFAAMPDGVEKTGLAMQLFGRSGKNMIPVLNEGSAGLKALGDEASKLGVVLTAENIEAIKQYTFGQRNLQEAMMGLKLQIGMAIIPVLGELAKKMIDGVLAAKQFGAEISKSLGPSVTAGIAAVKTMLAGLGTAAAPGIALLGDAFKGISSAVADFASRAGPAVLSILGQVSNVIMTTTPAVIMLQRAWTAITGTSGSLSSDLSAVRGVLDTVASAFEKVADPAGTVTTAFAKLAQIITATVLTIGDMIGPAMQNLWDDLVTGWQKIAPLIEPALNNIVSIVQSVLSLIGDFWAAHGNDILTIVKGVWDAVSTIIDGALNVVIAIVQTGLQVLAGDWAGAWETIQTIPEIVWNAIVKSTQAILGVLYNVVKVVVEALRLEDAWYGIRDFVQSVWVDIVNEVKRRLNEGIDAVNNFVSAINNVLRAVKLPTLSFALAKFDMSKFVPQGRPQWFTSANDQLDIFNKNLEITSKKSTAFSDLLKSLFNKPAKINVQDFITMAVPTITAPSFTGGLSADGGAAKAGLDAMKAAADAAKNSLDDMKQSLADLRDVAGAVEKQLNDAEAAMRGFASVRLPGMGAAEDEIYNLELQAKRARLAELGVGDAAQQSTQDVAASFDMLAAQQQELASGIPVALTRMQWEADQARQAANKAPTAAAGGGERTELQRINDLIEIKRLEMDLAFGPQQRALQKKYEDLTGASKEITFEDAIKGMVDSAAQASYLREVLGTINAKIGEGELAIRAQQDVVDALTLAYQTQKDAQDAIASKISDQNISLGDQVTTVAALNDSRVIAIGNETTIEDYLARERDRAQEQLDIVNQIGAAKAAQANIPIPPLPSSEQGNPTYAGGAGIGHFAEGGVTGGGMAVIGEKGPEVAYLPTGTRVIPGRPSITSMSTSRSFQDTYNVYDASRPIDVIDQIRRYQAFQRITRGR